MNLVRIGKSHMGAQAAFALARGLPRPTAYALGDRLFEGIARRPKVDFMRGLRINLAVAHDRPLDDPEIARVVLRLFRHTSRSYIDFARAAAAGPAAVAAKCRLSPRLYALLEQAAITERGLVVVGAHTCSFDFLLIALSRWCPDLLALTQARPTGSSILMNNLRRRLGLQLAPISPASLRDALTLLRRGGIVGIAADVPVRDGEELGFFSRPAHLSTGYARLALAAGTDVVVGICHRAGQDDYEIVGERVPPPGEPQSRRGAAHNWAQACLARLEGLLQRWPDEWLMPEPLWDAGAVPGASTPPATGSDEPAMQVGLARRPSREVSG